MSWKKRVIKTARILGLAAAVAAGLVVMIAGLLLLRPVRNRILADTLPWVQRSLPGDLVVASAAWPSLGTLEFESVMWTDGPDTLAAAGLLRASVDLPSLARRDIHVVEVTALGVEADVPAIVRRFESAGPKEEEPTTEKADRSFPRDGSLPGVPSLAVGRVEIDAPSVRVSEEVDLRGVAVRGAVELRRGKAPNLIVEELALAQAVAGSAVDSLWLTADLAALEMEGRGAITLPHGEVLYLDCRSDAERAFRIRLTRERDAAPPEVIGIDLEGRIRVDDDRARRVAFTLRFLTPGTEELRRIPALSDPLEPVAPLEGVGGVVAGTARLSPPYEAEFAADLFRSSWLDTVHAEVTYAGGALSVDSLLVGMPGLAVTATGHLPPEGGSASAHIRAEGMEWLTRVFPALTPPEGVYADLAVAAEGLKAVPSTRVSVRGRAAVSGVDADTLELLAEIPREGGTRPYAADLFLGSLGTSMGVRAEVSLTPRVVVRLSDPGGGARIRPSGEIQYDKVSRSLVVNRLHVGGDLGEYTVDARLDSLLRGSFEAACEWPAPPPLLYEHLRVDAVARAAIDDSWRAEGPFRVRLAGGATRRSGALALNATADLRLPGPRTLAPLAGADTGIQVADLGPIEGLVELSTGACDSAASFDARADLSQTGWLDTMLVDVGGCGQSFQIDSLLVSFEGIRVAASGGLQSGVWDIAAGLALADSQLVRRFLTGSDPPSLALEAAARFRGTAERPVLSATFDGRVEMGAVRVPRVEGTVELAGDSLDARLDLPRGLFTKVMALDSLSISQRARVGGEPAGGGVIRAHGPGVAFLSRMRWSKGEEVVVGCDELRLDLARRSLASRRPWSLEVSPTGVFRVADLLLEGSLGRIQAHGYVSSDSADFAAEAVIHAPEKPRVLQIADRLWPDSLSISANVDGPTTFRLRGQIDGVTLATGVPVSGRFEATADSAGVRALVGVHDAESALLTVDGRLPAYHLGDRLRNGPVVLDVTVDGFPLPANRRALTAKYADAIAQLDGRIAVRGTAAEPCAVAALYCRFTDAGVKLSPYRLAIEGQLAGSTAIDASLLPIRREWFRTELKNRDAPAGLSASLVLTKAEAQVLTGELFYPVVVSLSPVSTTILEGREMAFRLATLDVALTDLDPVLPPDIDLEGTTRFKLAATGPPRNPVLEGSFTTQRMKIISARDAQISPDIALELGGTRDRPSLAGEVQVRSGFIRIPENMTQLHPTKGTSLLWESADSARALADTITVGPPRPRRASESGAGTGTNMDFDVHVVIPGSFRIIGSRMNVELSGDLRLVQQGARPVLTGQLSPQSGQLMFMGRSFELRRGNVNFYGGDELNPSFDLRLESVVSGYRVEIRLTGTAEDPEIELSSDPQLSESDIMSLLVFGKPMGELNSSQSGLLQQRTAEILMMYGAVKLQEQMSQQMGVDIITIQQSTRKPEESALVVGKYINNRTLIKYEQNLQNTAAYLINLEYYLTKSVKLETFIDQASETGAEINWSRDY